MNWNKLKSMKCPKCGGNLITNNFGSRLIGCEDEENCGFTITQTRFETLVEDIYKGKNKKGYRPKFGDDLKNLEYLNNFDQNKADEEINN